jgi:hypothetical protein
VLARSPHLLSEQSYGGSRSQISGSTAAEVCYALQRYTCLPACTVEGMEAVVRQQQFKAEPKEVSYLVSLYRLLSLRAHEYQWLQTWSLRVNQAWANSLWTYVWGCPQVGTRNPCILINYNRYCVLIVCHLFRKLL